MLKGIKFKQQKPEIPQDLDLLLANDAKYVPQSMIYLKIPAKTIKFSFFSRKMEKIEKR